MATMNISLPDPLKSWVEDRTETGRYANSSDYVRDLIRRDVERQTKIEHMRALVDEGRASGKSRVRPNDIWEAAQKRSASL